MGGCAAALRVAGAADGRAGQDAQVSCEGSPLALRAGTRCRRSPEGCAVDAAPSSSPAVRDCECILDPPNSSDVPEANNVPSRSPASPAFSSSPPPQPASYEHLHPPLSNSRPTPKPTSFASSHSRRPTPSREPHSKKPQTFGPGSAQRSTTPLQNPPPAHCPPSDTAAMPSGLGSRRRYWQGHIPRRSSPSC